MALASLPAPPGTRAPSGSLDKKFRKADTANRDDRAAESLLGVGGSVAAHQAAALRARPGHAAGGRLRAVRLLPARARRSNARSASSCSRRRSAAPTPCRRRSSGRRATRDRGRARTSCAICWSAIWTSASPGSCARCGTTSAPTSRSLCVDRQRRRRRGEQRRVDRARCARLARDARRRDEAPRRWSGPALSPDFRARGGRRSPSPIDNPDPPGGPIGTLILIYDWGGVQALLDDIAAQARAARASTSRRSSSIAPAR